MKEKLIIKTNMKYTINSQVEIPKIGFAQRIINNIIWGDSHFNPNNKEKELVEEAQQLVYERD